MLLVSRGGQSFLGCRKKWWNRVMRYRRTVSNMWSDQLQEGVYVSSAANSHLTVYGALHRSWSQSGEEPSCLDFGTPQDSTMWDSGWYFLCNAGMTWPYGCLSPCSGASNLEELWLYSYRNCVVGSNHKDMMFENSASLNSPLVVRLC